MVKRAVVIVAAASAALPGHRRRPRAEGGLRRCRAATWRRSSCQRFAIRPYDCRRTLPFRKT